MESPKDAVTPRMGNQILPLKSGICSISQWLQSLRSSCGIPNSGLAQTM